MGSWGETETTETTERENPVLLSLRLLRLLRRLRPLGLLFEILQRRLMLPVLDPVGSGLRLVAGQEIPRRAAGRGGVPLEAGGGAAHDVPEQMAWVPSQDRVRQGQRAGE